MNKTSEDILIFGSSRASHHYVPSILKDSLGLSVYNCGLDGHGIYYAYGCLSMILERYSPKLIIYDVVEDTDMYEHVVQDYQNINSLYRYCSNASIKELIQEYSPQESILLKSHMYKYNEAFMHVFMDFLFTTSPLSRDGYLPIIGEYEENDIRAETLISNKWDVNKQIFVRRFIEACKERGIDIIFFYSPKYYGDSPMADQLGAFFKENNCVFINYANESTFLHNRLFFYDPNHLNNLGAEEYTRKIVQVLKPVINTLVL